MRSSGGARPLLARSGARNSLIELLRCHAARAEPALPQVLLLQSERAPSHRSLLGSRRAAGTSP